MNPKHVSSKNLLPQPKITPSHGNVLKYPEVTGGTAEIIFPSYPGITLGQEVSWGIRGNGIAFASFKILELKPQYEVKVRFHIVFDAEQVTADYSVRENDEVIGVSHQSVYTVIDRP
ncbi:hypothetical protein AB6N16_18715 [Pseudomonas marginalis]|uniref:hypothetical protein n=1 Tax=Pseudomonas fluorescens TaxID=294 RepID=UPI000F05FDAB|nr:hypothetical protein [Pseudomonas fluorescens]VVO28550.1 hypothetical protein PS720_04802 [Pseudomonas fluorescens]